MNPFIKYTAILGCTFVVALRLHAQGYIVPNGVVVDFDGLFTPGEIDVLRNPTDPNNGGYYTGFSLDPKSANTFQFNPVAGVGVRVFLVSPNDPISVQPIVSHNYTELMYPNTYVFNSGTPFYVGLYTGVNIAPGTPPNSLPLYGDAVFGWAELENVGGTIELLDSGLEYQGAGIYAGTQNIIAVPEPSVFGLLSLGALLLGRRIKRPNKTLQATADVLCGWTVAWSYNAVVADASAPHVSPRTQSCARFTNDGMLSTSFRNASRSWCV